MSELYVTLGDREERVSVERTESGYRVEVGERDYDVDLEDLGSLLSLLVGGRQHEVAVSRQGEGRYRVSSVLGTEEVVVRDPLARLAESSAAHAGETGRRSVAAYMPGRVVSLLVSEGETVSPGQGILVLEAMKMENEIQAETAGVVHKLLVEAGQAVEGGDPLFELEPA